jgi:uncharacterized protein YbaP (TraB family)
MPFRNRIARAALAALLLFSAALGGYAVPARADEALLWKAVSPEGREIYLLGSIHMARTSFYPLKDVINRAFESSGVLVLELDPGSTELASSLSVMMEKGFYPPPETLASHLDPETGEMFRDWVDYVPGGAETNMRPWLAAVVMSVTVLESMGYLVKEGVDRHFLAKAREKGLPFVQLETPEEQLSIFTDMSEEESMLFLRATLLELQNVEAMMDDLVNSWLAGDAGKFEEAFFAVYRDWPGLAPLLDRVIFVRNRVMHERLKAAAQGPGPALFAVIGSGHLVGSQGVPALFGQDGWSIEKY